MSPIRRRRAALVVRFFAILAALLFAPDAHAYEYWQAHTFKECDAHLRDQPTAYSCYRAIARREQSWLDGIRHLESRLALAPRDDLSRMALGTLMADIYDERAEQVMRQAAESLASRNERETEGYVRLELFAALAPQGRLAEADAELNRAAEDAELVGSDSLKANVEFNRGVSATYHNDHAIAWDQYKRVEAGLQPGSNTHLRWLVLSALGDEAGAMGRHDEALEYHRRAARILHATRDYYNEALLLAKVHSDTVKVDAQAGSALRSSSERETFQEALRAARRGGNLAASEFLLFGAAQSTDTPVAQKLELLDRALEDARRMHSPIQVGYVLRYKAYVLASNFLSRRPEAEAILQGAFEAARRAGDTEQMARTMLQQATIHINAGERERALSEWLAMLDMVERIRDHEPDEMVRAGIQSQWAFIYYRVAGYFLQQPGPGTPIEDMDHALSVIERMRARTLLDSLDAAGAATGGSSNDVSKERAEVLRRIVREQRGLLSPVLSEDERTRRLSRLEQLEAREVYLREQIARVEPAFAALRTPVIPSIRQLQEALAPEEALLSFQSDLDVSKTGWALLITRDTTRAFPLPNRASLNDEVSLFAGLLERRDGSEAAGAARLYTDLMEPSLAGLSTGTTRLVIIPDGPLHTVPFDLLRPGTGGEPLASRFEISLAPSCSTWLRWSRAQRAEAPSPVLALADPTLSAGPGAPAGYRAATLASGLSLGPLPRARQEARSVVSRLGGGSRLVVGTDATERSIKTAELNRFRMLHLAVHAVVDEQHPERSALLLAPGADDEDGLLQIREIVNLDLRGRLVILSSCSSASGTMVEGEGVMGLARAFFQAGAVAVVGSLWPLRDEEAAGLVEDMAAHLARGASISAALAAARRGKIKAGAPAASWAGLVVLGDGDFVPLPGGRAAAGVSPTLATLIAVLVLLGGGLLVRNARRHRPTSNS
jgi:CHAT domain-containing protein